MDAPAPNPKQDLIDLLGRTLPNADRLAVVPEEKEKVTKAGIVRSQIAKGEDETCVGLVVAVGPGYQTEHGVFIPTRNKPGDRVLMDNYAGVKLRLTRDGKFLAQHEDVTEERLPVRVIRQDAVLLTLPADWPQ